MAFLSKVQFYLYALMIFSFPQKVLKTKKVNEIYRSGKYPLCGYILCVQTHPIAWD